MNEQIDTTFRLFPEAASSIAGDVDDLYLFLLLVTTFFTVLIFVLITYFVLRYRRGAVVRRVATHSRAYLALEILWTCIPFILTMVMFGWGAELFLRQRRPVADADTINVVGKQWMWKMQHARGRQEINALHVPAGRPMLLRMISEDVIHSFYVPAFRLKQDVLPGRYTTLWFEATRPGTYHLFCAEYCGTEHSRMVGQVVVLEPAEFAAWLSGAGGETPERSGQQLFEQFRCSNCHANPASPRCPPLEGVFGRTVRLTDGTTTDADESYLRESIIEPAAKIVAGYTALMPSYKGQLDETQLFQLIAYLKSLSPPQTEPPKIPAAPEP